MVWEAIVAARDFRKVTFMAETKVVGTSVPRGEGGEKVSGRSVYAADVKLAGLLWAKILRSPHPHARIRGVDTAKAEKVPGVRAIITGADVKGLSDRQADSRYAGAVLGQGAFYRRSRRRGGGGNRGRRRRSDAVDRSRLRGAARGIRSVGGHGGGRAHASRRRCRLRWRAGKNSRYRFAQRFDPPGVAERRRRKRFS